MPSLKTAALHATILLALAIPASAMAQTGRQCGDASWYAMDSRTASGEQMDPDKFTAAHRSLPFGTMVRVTHMRNGRSTVVRVNDRGPFIKGRILDLSKAAANKLGIIKAGHASICFEVVP